jgi:hypothetical protein
MPIITILQQFGPTAGEQYVSYPVKAVQFTDGSLATSAVNVDANAVVLDCDLHNMAMLALLDDDDSFDYDSTTDGTPSTNIGIVAGFQ